MSYEQGKEGRDQGEGEVMSREGQLQAELFGDGSPGLPAGTKFGCIVADPPWEQKAGPGGLGHQRDETGRKVWNMDSRESRDLPYDTLPVEQMCKLPVGDLVADDAHLYLWTTNRYVEQSYGVARAWGFKPSTMLVWAKAPMGGGLGGDFGISTEFILYCRRGRPKAKTRVTGTWFAWKRPYDGNAPIHSAKPEAFQTMVESVSPGPYLELFARRRRPGWSVWGNQVVSDLNLEMKG